MGEDQAQQYGLRSGTTLLIKIRPYKIDLDQALHYGFRSGPTIGTTCLDVGIFSCFCGV